MSKCERKEIVQFLYYIANIEASTYKAIEGLATNHDHRMPNCHLPGLVLEGGLLFTFDFLLLFVHLFGL
jgi:hypothetical protein